MHSNCYREEFNGLNNHVGEKTKKGRKWVCYQGEEGGSVGCGKQPGMERLKRLEENEKER